MRPAIIITSCALLVTIGCGAAIHAALSPASATTPTSEPCQHAAPGTARACLTTWAQEVMNQRGEATMLREVRQAARADRNTAADCHMALHPIGNDIGKELARSGRPLPLRRPTDFCEEGFVHGLQIAWLSSASPQQLRHDGVRACSAADSDADWTCGHSLGHALAKSAGDTAHMATVIGWCQDAWSRAVHLGLDHDSFLSTCARGATMEMSFADARLDRGAPRTPCAGVAPRLVLFCDAHVWMRVDPDVSNSPTARRAACRGFTRTRQGRAACLAMMTRPDRLSVTDR